MSTPINDGGPAFPTKHPTIDPRAAGFHTEEGMSLRDYFAAAALQGMIASGEQYDGSSETSIQLTVSGCFASAAYALADAMLAERAKGGAK